MGVIRPTGSLDRVVRVVRPGMTCPEVAGLPSPVPERGRDRILGNSLRVP